MGLFKKKMSKQDYVDSYQKAKEKKQKAEQEIKEIRVRGIQSNESINAIREKTAQLEGEVVILQESMEYSRQALVRLIEAEIQAEDDRAVQEFETKSTELAKAQREAGKCYAELVERLQAAGLAKMLGDIQSAVSDSFRTSAKDLSDFIEGQGEYQPGQFPNVAFDKRNLSRRKGIAVQHKQMPGAVRRRAEKQAAIMLGEVKIHKGSRRMIYNGIEGDSGTHLYLGE